MKIRMHSAGMPLTVARMRNGNAAAPEDWRPVSVPATLLGTFMWTALAVLSVPPHTTTKDPQT